MWSRSDPQVLGRIGTPWSPALGSARSSRDVGLFPNASVKASNRPMSPAGNASGSRNSRIAMYCAVHSPMPGRARSRVTHSVRLRAVSRICGFATTAAASDASVPAHVPRHSERRQVGGRQMFGTGKTCVSPSISKPVPDSGSP